MEPSTTRPALGQDITLPLRLTESEVRELWEFLHGDIMEAGTRVLLRKSLGLCPRHTWAYAQSEIELWQHGAGGRHGHQPFDVCVLYDDLLDEAIRRLTSQHLPWHRTPAWTLRADGSCHICAATDRPPHQGSVHGYAGLDIRTLTAEANKATFTTAWIDGTVAVWAPRACRTCLPGDPGAGLDDDAVMCRPHLLQRDQLDRAETQYVCQQLARVRNSVRRLVDSMTQGGAPASAADEASWVEALAWFTGWAPLRDWNRSGPACAEHI